jgi:hypothetical protein
VKGGAEARGGRSHDKKGTKRIDYKIGVRCAQISYKYITIPALGTSAEQESRNFLIFIFFNGTGIT